jgi:hypothetical protein
MAGLQGSKALHISQREQACFSNLKARPNAFCQERGSEAPTGKRCLPPVKVFEDYPCKEACSRGESGLHFVVKDKACDQIVKLVAPEASWQTYINDPRESSCDSDSIKFVWVSGS